MLDVLHPCLFRLQIYFIKGNFRCQELAKIKTSGTKILNMVHLEFRDFLYMKS